MNRYLITVFFSALMSISSYAQEEDSVDRMAQKIFPGAEKIETSQPCWGTQPVPQEYVINEVAILDTFLLEQIEQLIQEMEQVDSIFASGDGYIRLYIRETNGDANVTQWFMLAPSFAIPDTENEAFYPHNYTWINNRLVFLHYESLSELICLRHSKKSKRHINRLVKPLLPEGDPKLAALGFQFVYFHFHWGKYIYYFLDKTPEVYLDMYSPIKQLDSTWQQPGVVRQQK